ncbi:MAG: hypothetical protein F6K37_13600 [Moorea sp. SIO4E2]|uniref:hypothetical protein n=1 Tax=Moorena sp. SIO4E2 TaxID=2607826 RepID=UPI0013BD30DE|nr:hypothetical protein [Moorena sp. SIO4E2]NEQ06932.1 hypothetical protein [Moorena sp. SIO4E2]
MNYIGNREQGAEAVGHATRTELGAEAVGHATRTELGAEAVGHATRTELAILHQKFSQFLNGTLYYQSNLKHIRELWL